MQIAVVYLVGCTDSVTICTASGPMPTDLA